MSEYHPEFSVKMGNVSGGVCVEMEFKTTNISPEVLLNYKEELQALQGLAHDIARIMVYHEMVKQGHVNEIG